MTGTEQGLIVIFLLTTLTAVAWGVGELWMLWMTIRKDADVRVRAYARRREEELARRGGGPAIGPRPDDEGGQR